MNERKTIKITLPVATVEKFNAAKARAEHSAMLKLSDSQYASRLIQWAIDFQSCAALVVSRSPEGRIVLQTIGEPGSEEFDQAITASMLLEQSWESGNN